VSSLSDAQPLVRSDELRAVMAWRWPAFLRGGLEQRVEV